MAKKTKTRQITFTAEKGTFSFIFKKTPTDKKHYDFEGLAAFRNLLSNEKARILHVIKNKNPASIYALSRVLERDFKAVLTDVKLLERFGFIDLIAEKTGKRERLKPIIVVDSINVEIRV